MPGPYFDIMVADYLLNPNRRAHTVEAIAMDLLSYQLGGGADAQASKEPASLFDAEERQIHDKQGKRRQWWLRLRRC